MTHQSSPGEGLTDEQIQELRAHLKVEIKAHEPAEQHLGSAIAAAHNFLIDQLCDMALRVRALEQDNERLNQACDHAMACIETHNRARLAAESRAEASAKDAARYRWLRAEGSLKRAAHIAVLTKNGGYVATEELADSAIDAAIDAAKEQKRG